MKGKRLILIIIAGILFLQANGQQDPGYTQYMFNTLSINPAYAGSRDMISALLLSRHQWVGFNGAPSTQTFSIHSPITDFNSGIGLSVINDKIGPTQETSLFFDYAFIIKMGEKGTLSMGLKSGFNIFQSNLSQVETDQTDELFQENTKGKFLPNIGLGFYFHKEKYYVGISSPSLLKNKLNATNDVLTETVGKEELHYFLIGGYVFDVSPNIKMKPSALVRIVNGAPITIDLTANALIKDHIWVGLMHRFGDSFGVLFQYQFNNNIRVGYAFDLATTELIKYNAGTHEIMIGYDFNLSRNKVISPRYF